MQWFPHAWHVGELPDEEDEGRIDAYEAHLAKLARRLPPEVAALANLNLHDGQVQEWRLTAETFRWRLLVGDLQRGYEFVTLTYHGVELIELDEVSLTGLMLDTKPGAELVSDELDTAGDGRYEHRFYFWPGHEFGIRFTGVDVSTEPAPAQARR